MFLFLSRKKERKKNQKTSLFKIKMWFLIFQLDIGCESSPGLRSGKEPEKQGHSRCPHNWTSGTNPAVSTHLSPRPVGAKARVTGTMEPATLPPIRPAFGVPGPSCAPDTQDRWWVAEDHTFKLTSGQGILLPR